MNIDPQQVHTFKVHFETSEHVPPPYYNTYNLEVRLCEGETPASFEIKYLHREELSEEEIFEEGFSLEDDWQWKGNLPENWKEAIKTHIGKQSWPRKPEKPDPNDAILNISLLDSQGNKLFEGQPADLSSWEYFLQELIQAIYETGEKEAPFLLQYREIASGQDQLDILLEASFAKREIAAKRISGGNEEEAKPDWKELKQLMKLIFLPDYDYDGAKVQEPKKRGKYLTTGEGLWFKFGESLTEPDKKSNSLDRLEKELKGLFE